MRWLYTIVALMLALTAASSCPGETVIYDGNAVMSLPDWYYEADPANVYYSFGSPGTILDTTPVTDPDISAGFAYTGMPTLDPSVGFSVSFDVQVTHEDHFGDDQKRPRSRKLRSQPSNCRFVSILESSGHRTVVQSFYC